MRSAAVLSPLSTNDTFFFIVLFYLLDCHYVYNCLVQLLTTPFWSGIHSNVVAPPGAQPGTLLPPTSHYIFSLSLIFCYFYSSFDVVCALLSLSSLSHSLSFTFFYLPFFCYCCLPFELSSTGCVLFPFLISWPLSGSLANC